ncbi:hypothetical protein Mal52_05490 [Symmachiella dynata]|uniref:Uncharacterized protein n=1 Tax=Symmachiella dynata TaxID=2527995 RepID=A0A517ZHZ0_9PLAN|nr:hypothetical protein Mal52_05490 [Symmachiella dynata]
MFCKLIFSTKWYLINHAQNIVSVKISWEQHLLVQKSGCAGRNRGQLKSNSQRPVQPALPCCVVKNDRRDGQRQGLLLLTECMQECNVDVSCLSDVLCPIGAIVNDC